ncbi:AraC transcriptional regulator [Frankia casuarinae]|uniref:GlxA family transcriptional regulator n=1 Tax=Frankia TaxID=1854 RepID=UPI0003D04D2B|nr:MULTISPECIES: helix-turn-helix domain-containing protein [Frankia]ETA01545.1 transcriptional regulator [Frankia sp. CcI6]EYT91917.1 AraC transcriptional regulator [Frankia casuarinae]KDA42656.1 transcriptional regulator, AraC family with amidase-like domain [Frankia sp. BMG5.23]KEZ35549.1 transcriptional regulator containing an amidase domain and an AraC-type DNA-binding HTH domain [Frankia sp. CeD]KFB04565.1 transcriptional regulator containing an amidase domain and an AraC-type DNA-bindin
MLHKETATRHAVVALAVPATVAMDLAIPAQVFGHLDLAEHYTFTLCTEQPGSLPTTTGFALEVAHGLAALDAADTVVVPGYAPLVTPAPGVLDALRAAADRGVRLMSVCTGAFALAAAGLLDGQRATTHWEDAGDLAARHPTVQVDPNVLYVDGERILTSAGVCAGIDLCLHILRRDLGSAVATRVARRLVVAPHRAGGQAQLLRRPVPGPKPGSGGPGRLAATCDWALERLAEPLSVADLAGHAGYATRTFARRFIAEYGVTPRQWLLAHRIAEARLLLEVTDLPVDRIAARCGLGTAANLRIHLARDAANTPSAYRASYQGRPRRASGRADELAP